VVPGLWLAFTAPCSFVFVELAKLELNVVKFEFGHERRKVEWSHSE